MEVYYQKSAVFHKLSLLKSNNKKIALVPTMGFLHEAHLSLVKQAKKLADIVVVTIFVNPTQFNEQTDFNNYPRNEERDLSLLRNIAADIVFIPAAGEIYADNFSTYVEEDMFSKGLCGATRPGHLRGVCTIISKLFNIIRPDIALFGEKDYQQYAVIRKFAADLDIATEIISCKTIREDSGLAMSSRNERLPDVVRENVAPLLFANMKLLAEDFKNDPQGYLQHVAKYTEKLLEVGFQKVDYLQIYNCQNFREYNPQDEINDFKDYRVFAAAFINDVRLIDNLALC